MIVVTGSARSGTSLMMQTLKLLDVPIEGHKFHDDFPVKEANPKGYYDLPFEVLRKGLGEEYIGKAVKLLGEWLPYTNPENLTHVIVCKRRDSRAQDRSVIRCIEMETEIESPSEIRKKLLEMCLQLSPDQISERRRNNYELIESYLTQLQGYCMDVYYEDMLYNSAETVQEIKEFVDSEASVDAAIKNIDRSFKNEEVSI
jgi:hypothetical protein